MSDLIKHYRQLVGIANTWAGKNLPGWDDDMHRELLARHGATGENGRISASTLKVPQLAAVLDDYAGRGWPRRKQYAPKGDTRPKVVSPQIGMIVKLWGKLGQAGKVNNAARPALLAFCSRQTAHNVPDLDSLTPEERQAIIEALKAWMAR
ncbi:regulatory protein GemA [Methylomonas sp. SURF-2]|uniref:Regulatory protein GemA n=1 Tax=Methylomonas subterranea TaxID=2952225 RepID=A0ABT1TD75_9GAMM|nr:regulatory protein GemA [Methylomonas sp. SURF-2]MCQ8103254.1 regulatory protein GemA [Methylomonas sp. SURF-2]